MIPGKIAAPDKHSKLYSKSTHLNVDKQPIHGHFQFPGQTEGQGQGGVVLVVLNGVHRLAGHAAALGQLLLGDPQLTAPLSDTVFHISHRASS